MAEYIYDFKEPPDPEGYCGRLIRCKDCKHSSIIPNLLNSWMECRFHGRLVIDIDFCSWGERREDAKTD